MNFLAHGLLAGEASADRAGGLMGDFIKGLLPGDLPADLAEGVALHRAIDSFAERHPAFVASRARISPLRRRFGGILIDLFYDHLLAREWARFSPHPLSSFSRELYSAVEAHWAFLPEGARTVAERMRTQDWLSAYRDIDAVGRAIDRMAIYRMRRSNPLGGGIEEFLRSPEDFLTDFEQFLTDALVFASQWRAGRKRAGES